MATLTGRTISGSTLASSLQAPQAATNSNARASRDHFEALAVTDDGRVSIAGRMSFNSSCFDLQIRFVATVRDVHPRWSIAIRRKRVRGSVNTFGSGSRIDRQGKERRCHATDDQ